MTKRANGDGSVFKRSPKGRWWISWYDENGVRRQRSSGTTDRRLADRILREQTERVRMIREGLIDTRAEAMVEIARSPIGEVIELFIGKVREAGRSAPYIKKTESLLTAFVESSKVTTLGDITPDTATADAERLRKLNKSARTRQERLTAIKGLTRWAWREGMIPADPLAGVSKPNPEADRRRRRRMLSVEEWHRLEAAALSGGDRLGMTGPMRAMLYATAIQTGLRANELRALRRSSLHLDSEKPFVVVEAGRTKNRKVARQYVRPELAERLKAQAAMLTPGAPVFRLPSPGCVAKMLRADLKAARMAWLDEVKNFPEQAAKRAESDFLLPKDHDGRVIDFHALRHTCGAWAAVGGASPKAIQTLMRHSQITLTMDTYGHLLPGEEAETVGRMPGFDRVERLAQTGTADCCNPVSNGGAKPGDSVRAGANGRTSPDTPPPLRLAGISRDDADLCEPVRSGAGELSNSPARIRTEDRTIMSRVL